MKKITLLSLTLSSLLMGVEEVHIGNISEDHTFEATVSKEGIHLGGGWLFSGDMRTGWVEYGYNNPPPGNPAINRGHIDSKGWYIMPKLSITTPTYAGFAAKITGAGATDFGINDPAYESRNFVFNAADPKSYAILQESYIRYDANGNLGVVGRQEVSTPMIDTDDWYMLANSFEVAYYTNTMLEDQMFSLGYFHKMAGVWDSGAYDPVLAPKGGTDFYSMSQASFVSTADKAAAGDSGVVFGAYQYNDERHNLQVWEYYATDLYNTLFLQYDFSSKVGEAFSYNLGAQIIDFQEVGKLASNNFSAIDYSMYSARFNGAFSNGVDFATGLTKYTDGEGQGSTLGAWGGYPYFANGMIFHFFEAGSLQNAASYKAQLGYALPATLAKDIWFGARYTHFDLDSDYSKASNGLGQEKMNLYGVRLSYGSQKGTYFTGTYERVNLDHEEPIDSLRLIGGWRF